MSSTQGEKGTRSRVSLPGPTTYVFASVLAVPTLLGASTAAAVPTSVAVFGSVSQTPSGALQTQFGAQLEQRLRENRLRLRFLEEPLMDLGNMVFASMPSAVRKHQMRIVRKDSALQMPESEEEIKAYVAAL